MTRQISLFEMMPSDNPSFSFSEKLLHWFDQFGRKNLPWQHNKTAYRVWISEIMLQQTQVTTVIPYYERFMQRFPDIESLAQASVDEVLSYWAGLGYYARGRNLHKAAVTVMENFAGEFPDKLEDIQSLPGIGQSTAGAIASIALKQRAPILDGNVKRVLARFAAIEGWTGEKSVSNQLWKLADELTPHQRVDEYTQAIMDLGASLCSRRNPDCGQCPMQSACKAFAQGRQNELPTPKPKSKNPVKEAWILAIRDSKGRLLFQKRPPTGIWGGLWSLPQVERDLNIAQLPDYIASQLGLQGQYKAEATPFEHQFSHFKLVLHPILFECENTVSEAVREYSREAKVSHEVQASYKTQEAHKIQEGFTDSQFYSRAQWREIGLPAPIKKLLSSDSLPIKEQIELEITEDI